MTRNHLLRLSTRALPANQLVVWRMTMDLLGLAFGAAPSRREPRR